jgi:uncharacterized protein (TIGR03084 family)
MAVDLAPLADDLAAETEALDHVLESLDAAGWNTPTPAAGWRVHDQISHLAYFDEAATTAATDPDKFRADLAAAIERGDDITGSVQARFAAMPAGELLAWFRATRGAMVRAMTALDPSTRVPWYGPDMSVASMLTARIMETWAHGQDVFDALGRAHPVTRALKQVAYIGVRAVPNSFVARGLAVPDAAIFVALHAPDGSRWEWGDPGADDRVEGDAVEFCGVVTQRCNVADTSLAITGPVATQWMQIAQAFAGPPGAGRPPTGVNH